MRKPSNRIERINFICQKKGQRIKDIFIYMTDRELKRYFDMIYPLIKDKQDATKADDTVQCIRCGCDVEMHLDCNCGVDRAVFTEEEWKNDIDSADWSEMKHWDLEFIKNNYHIPSELMD